MINGGAPNHGNYPPRKKEEVNNQTNLLQETHKYPTFPEQKIMLTAFDLRWHLLEKREALGKELEMGEIGGKNR